MTQAEVVAGLLAEVYLLREITCRMERELVDVRAQVEALSGVPTPPTVGGKPKAGRHRQAPAQAKP